MARRGPIGAALAAACLAGCALWPTGAIASIPAQTQIGATGSLTYVWHGDPGAGCASHNLCGIRGAVVFSQFQSGSLVSFKHSGKSAFLFGMATARVRRQVSSGAAAECLNPIDGPVTLTLLRAGGRLEARVAPSDLSGPCAGPLPGDVSRIALPVSRTRDGGYDLRGRVPLDAGPFRGQLISTLVLRPAHGGSGSSGGFTGTFVGGGGGGRAPGGKVKQLKEFVVLTYGLTGGTQPLKLGFSGDPGPFCEALDNCGASGLLILTLPTQQSTLQLDAIRTVRSRQAPGQILRDFRRDPAAFSLAAFAGLAGQAAETFSWPGGATCRDSAPTSGGGGALQLALLGPRPTRHGERAGGRETLRAVLSIAGAQGALRTHCPGPDFTNVFGQQSVLARGALSIHGLFDHQQVLDLTRRGSLETSGYVVRRSGSLELHLSLRSARARTLTVR